MDSIRQRANADDDLPSAKRQRRDGDLPSLGAFMPSSRPPSPTQSLPPRQSIAAIAQESGLFRGPEFDRIIAAQRYPALTTYLAELESAFRENRTPVVKDLELMPDIIAGLNKADSRLRLDSDLVMQFEPLSVVEDYRLVKQLERGLVKGGDWRMVIDDQDIDHRYALGVHCDPAARSASLILVDSLAEASETIKRAEAWRDILDRIGKVLSERLPGDPPVRLHLAVSSTTTQRTPEGCCIFALSAARKLAAEPSIADLHRAALARLRHSEAATVVSPLPSTRLPASFLKHSTSGNDLLDNLFRRDESNHARRQDGVFNPVVNRQNQTLLERWTSNLTSREDEKAGKHRWYSNSYEAKRIELVRTALAHLIRPDGSSS